MGWGTFFKTEIYISRQHFNTIGELESTIHDYEESIEWSEKALLMYASATPKKSVEELHSDVQELIDNIKHDLRELEKLYLLRDVGLDNAVKD